MLSFSLVTDSCADDYKSVFEKEQIECISLAYHDGENTFYDNFDSKEEYYGFYERLKVKNFKTTALVPYEIEELLTKLLAKYDRDIVFISLSSGLSSSYRNAVMVANELNEKNEHKIYVVDSLSATQGQHLIVDKALELNRSGFSAKDAVDVLNTFVKKLSVFFYVTDLETLKRGGRVSPLQATFSKVIQLRPILSFNEDGELSVVGKAIGTKGAMKVLVDKLVATYDTELNYPIYIARTNNDQEVQDIITQIKSKLPNAEIKTGFVGPIIASHTGASLLGVLYISK